MNIGENIRVIRELKGLSQQGLADELGISQKSLSRIEMGQVSPSFQLVEEICNYLDLDLVQFSRFDQKQLLELLSGKELPGELPLNFDEIRRLYQLIIDEKERHIIFLERLLEKLSINIGNS